VSTQSERAQDELLLEWRRRVAQANAAGDTQELAELFAEVRALVGPERASHLWLQAMSAFDASAVTG
jgi:hypothetical protein